jgi:outer membrane biosynthesis protein TonB
MTIEKELLEVSGMLREARPNEEGHVYRARLIRKVSAIPDDKWEGLSEDAQGWVNAGVEAMESKQHVADFPGVEKVEEPTEVIETEEIVEEPIEEGPKSVTSEEKALEGIVEKETEEKEEKPKEKVKEKKPAKVKKEKKPKVEKKKKEKGPTVTYLIVKTIIQNPEMSKEKVQEKIEKDSGKVANLNSINIIKYRASTVVKVLKELNMLKE